MSLPPGMVAWLRWRQELPIVAVESMPARMAAHFEYLTGKYGKGDLDPGRTQHEQMVQGQLQKHQNWAQGYGWG